MRPKVCDIMILLSFFSKGKEYVYFLYNENIEYGYKELEYIKQDLSKEEIALMDRYVKFISIDNCNYLEEADIRYKRKKYIILSNIDTNKLEVAKRVGDYYAIYLINERERKKLEKIIKGETLKSISKAVLAILCSMMTGIAISKFESDLPYSSFIMEYALDKNDNLTDDEKNILKNHLYILEENKQYVDTLSIFDSIRELDIEYSINPDEYSLERDALAYYSCSEDKIIINYVDEYEDIEKDEYLQHILSHEIAHCYSAYHYGFCRSFKEAVAEISSYEYEGDVVLSKMAYKTEVISLYSLCEIIGAEPFKKLIYSGDTYAVVDALAEIIDDRELAIQLINNIDSLNSIKLENDIQKYDEAKYKIYEVIARYFEAKYGYNITNDETMMIYFCYGKFIPEELIPVEYKFIKEVYPKNIFVSDDTKDTTNLVYTYISDNIVVENPKRDIQKTKGLNK